jgi:transposase-like protein
MAEHRRNDGHACTRAAVRLVTEPGSGGSETARQLGSNAQMLGRWTREVEAPPSAAVPGNGGGSCDQEA